MTKYADESSLQVPEKHEVDFFFKMYLNVRVEHNEMHAYTAKTKEIVFHLRSAITVLFPSVLPGIERVLRARLLGIWLQCR